MWSWPGSLHKRYAAQMEQFAFQNALSEVFAVISRANKYIDETAPWILARDESNLPRLACVMYNLLETIRICGGLLQPFMPDTSAEILRRIGASENADWDSLCKFGLLPREAAVTVGAPLFPAHRRTEGACRAGGPARRGAGSCRRPAARAAAARQLRRFLQGRDDRRQGSDV